VELPTTQAQHILDSRTNSFCDFKLVVGCTSISVACTYECVACVYVCMCVHVVCECCCGTYVYVLHVRMCVCVCCMFVHATKLFHAWSKDVNFRVIKVDKCSAK